VETSSARVALEPVDSLTITTLVDNLTDVFMPDQGVAHRSGPTAVPRRTVSTLEGPSPDQLIAEHGFSALITIHKNGQHHRLLFDTGVSPDGMVENMRRLDIDPGQLHAVLGGFHLNGPMYEPLIPRVCSDLSGMAPAVVVPAHCTGWRAQHALARTFGEAFVPNSVGTSFVL
jgi:metal-dependent hydrolase (beta-lactamase superfamily II)